MFRISSQEAAKQEREMDAVLPPVRLPSELLEKAKRQSKDTGVPIAFVVRKALEEWVKGKK